MQHGRGFTPPPPPPPSGPTPSQGGGPDLTFMQAPPVHLSISGAQRDPLMMLQLVNGKQLIFIHVKYV